MTSITGTASPGSSSRAGGIALVAAAAITWSLGGTMARFLEVTDPWTIVFWRATFAALFLIGWLLLREGLAGTERQVATMGLPGVGVALCFATASIAFVVALGHTTVANILLMQAAVPLVAALLGWLLMRERVAASTWLAIGAVVAGVATMVSASFTGKVSPIGDALALLITVSFAGAIVITRRWSRIAMVPATALAMVISVAIALALAPSLAVSPADLLVLFCFGALNLGLGLIFFSAGTPQVPATVAALISTIEPVLGPVWVWLVHGELPGVWTLLGGSIIVAAIVFDILMAARRGGGARP